MKNLTLSFLCIFIFFSYSSAQLKSPDEFLPHKLGEHFTPHHYLHDYFSHVAEESPYVVMQPYGKTNQDRPLFTVIISSPKNLERLGSIRNNNLKLAGLNDNATPIDENIAIVWLSFSVHGNEAAGSESSYQVIYELADPGNLRTKEWLENTVVIIDPSINPDGYSRYTHWVRNVAATKLNPNLDDIEHQEPWPGGRTNHYFFDLNRDWAWLTQVESQQRLKLYRQWLPHVHADLHEMGYNSPYYFAPAAQPYHRYITDFQREFQFDIGKNHAKYFDENGWLFFTREVFDLFYPSYGDTYPTFNGAIGMTYEQGGSGRAGRAITIENGETLSLADRIAHHKTTALSTIEISSKNADKLVKNFTQFFSNSITKPPGKYKSYIIKADKSQSKLKSLCQLLDAHGIQYGTVSSSKSGRGFNYIEGEETEFTIDKGDMLISAYQANSILTQILFDPESQLVDSLTYDITAWSLPYAYGLHAYASTAKMQPENSLIFSSNEKDLAENAVAYTIDWNSLSSAQALARLMEDDITVRFTKKELSSSDKNFAPGTIIITKADNKTKHPNLAKSVLEALNDIDIEIRSISTGFSDKGPDLGSRSIQLIGKPKIMTLRGDRVGSSAYGQIRYFFEQNLQLPLNSVEISRLDQMDFSTYTIIILPDGFYSLSNRVHEKLKQWIRGGGKLIVMAGALNNFADKDGYGLKRYGTEEEKKAAEKATEKKAIDNRLGSYEESDRMRISNQVPGAIVKYKLDSSNPMAYGFEDSYFSLKTSGRSFGLLKSDWNVAWVPEKTMVLGFMGSEIRNNIPNTLTIGVEEQGRGSIVYMVDNLLFRGFWENGKFLFSNALFFAGK